MTKVLHIRGVPEDVHAVLAEAARAQGLSLSSYAQRELEHLAARRQATQAMQANVDVCRRTQAKVQSQCDRDTILSVLHESRGA